MARPALVVLASVMLAAACADPPKVRTATPPPPPRPANALSIGEGTPTSEQVPVIADDPIRGPKIAPVTVVMFSDFQCPFCKRVEPTIQALLQAYPGKIRLVWKDLPLDFHKYAREAAVVSRVVQLARGDEAFWQFHDRVFEHQTDLSNESLHAWAGELGVDEGVIQTYRSDAEARVDRSVAEAKRLGIQGTPNFMIDGEALTGAQPLAKFQKVVDAHLQKAAELASQGVQPFDVYAKMVQGYWQAPKPPEAAEEEPEDLTVWKVEVGNAPTHGPKDAPVTVVVFSDFQCPFCKRIETTFEQLDKAYPGKLRFVWKNQPLKFHARAMPAALAAWEVYKQKGEGAFFKMHAALFASAPKLEAEDLEAAAQLVPGIDVKKVLAAVEKDKWRADLENDMEQAESLKVSGTPHSFVNGRAITGAQPFDKFKKLIDAELAKAEAKLKAGTAPDKLYAETIASGKLIGAAVDLPIPADAPWKGGAKAKVVLQVFSDFQCPFCKRLARPQQDDSAGQTGALDRVATKYGDKIKIVWRDFPLSFHPRAMPAAVLAREAKKQKGNAAFWKAHDELFDATSLEDPALEAIAKRLGLDWGKVGKALAQESWKDAIEADQKAGNGAGVSGTPAVFVNGKLIAGAQSEDVYVKAIDKALAKAK